MTFYPGQKVVFVGGPDPQSLWEAFLDWCHPEPSDDLIKGWVYTVERIIPDMGTLDLVGFYSPGDDYWCPGYMVEAFRPAIDRKTDISVFQRLLKRGRANA